MTIELAHSILSAEGSPQSKLIRFFGKNISYDNARKYWSGVELAANAMILDEQAKGGYVSQQEISFNKDNSKTFKRDIFLDEEERKNLTPILVMKKLNLDPLLWQVINCKIVEGSWDVTMKMDETEEVDGVPVKKQVPKTSRNYKYSITLTVKPMTDKLTDGALKEVFESIKTPKIEDYSYSEGNGRLLELPIMDFHVGKYSDPEQVGNAEYNIDVAEKLYKKTILDILSRVSAYGIKIEKIVFPVGQDFFHVDTPKGTTTSGTQLEYQGTWQSIFSKGVELLVWAIEQFRPIAPVSVMWVPGNHDEMLSYCATVGLFHTYQNSENVYVDIEPTPRKYFQYGENLIGYSHGKGEGRRIFGLMQVEQPEAWGQTTYREWHLGDLHHESAKEDAGIIFRRISTITGADSWHIGKGYVGTVRKAMAFIWDKKNGLELVINSNVEIV